jgi:predicted dehydrogenase
MEGEAVRFGIIGLGLIYRIAHVLAFQEPEKARAVAVCDLDEGLVAAQAQALGARGYHSYSDLLADPDVEAVDIILPHNLHFAVAKAALEAGKHVVIEKPMTVASQDSLALITLAQRLGLRFTVAENTRFIPAYAEVKRLIQAGVIGEPTLVRTLISGSEIERLTDSSLWKGRKDGSCGGVIIDGGAHSFYLLKWLIGEVASLQALAGKLVPESEVEDWAVVTGRFTTGGLFSVEFTFTSGGPWNERLEVHGREGLIVSDQLREPSALYYSHKRDYDGTPLVGAPFAPRTWKYRSIADGILDFAAAVRENRPTGVDPMDGWYAVRMVEKAYESVATGKPASFD